MEREEAGSRTLLISNVGGNPPPIQRAIGNIKPARVVFVCSKATEPDLSGPRAMLRNSQREPVPPDWPWFVDAGIDSSSATKVVVSDHERIDKCIESQREKITNEVTEWLGRSASHRVIVDITGGTKVMSAALALCARQWPCRYYYTGGTERENNNVGIVVDGSEREFETANPWDALGYQAMEEFRLFFNANQFAAARFCAQEAKKRAGDEAVKRKFQAWETLASGYAAWESFDHATALTNLKSVAGKYANDMAANGDAIWGGEQKNLVGKNIEQLTQLSGSSGKPTAMMVFELLANAQRRGAEGRYDDAVARLYRCTEAIAQFRLLDKYNVNSGAVPLDRLPKSLQDKWASRAEGGMLKLALQDDYALLGELGDDLGKKFTDLAMAGEKSPLSARNSSILAHGFIPISKEAYSALLKRVQDLAEALGGLEAGGINFPKIGGQGSTKPQSGQ